MIAGLDRFRQHFADSSSHYVLIGGAACALAMAEAGLDFRVTKDLDIVLCVETLDATFVNAFWRFIKIGGYKNRRRSTGKKLFYRFDEPEDESFPWMLELFSRIPDSLAISSAAHLTPIPTDEETSSLSAILLDEGYYGFIHESKRETDGLMIAPPECLVPLKAKAWLDLTERKMARENIDAKTISKHRNDIFRLFQLISPETRVIVPDSIRNDLRAFFAAMEAGPPADLKPFGIKSMGFANVLKRLRETYGLGD